MAGQDDSACGATAPNAKSRAARFPLPRGRLLSHQRFGATFNANNSSAGRHIVMWIRATAGERGQVGVIAQKKIFPRAVDRNRAKRILREAYRLQQHEVHPEMDLILLARKPILNASLSEVKKTFRYLCRRAKIWDDT